MQVASNPALANPAPVSPPPPPAAPSDPQAAAGPGPNGTPSASDSAATGPGEQPGSYFAGYTKPLIQRPDGTTFAPGPGTPLLDVAAQAVTAFGAQPESFNAMTQPLYLGRASSSLLADLMSGGQPLPTGGDAPWGRPEYVPRPQAALADMGMLSRPGVTTNNKGPLRVDNPDAYFAGTAPGRLQRVPDLVQRQPDGRGSQGEQDAFSGQPGNQDGQQPLPQQADNGPYPPGKDGTPLRAKDPVGVDGRYPPGKDGHPLRATEPLRPPGKDGNPLRATEPSPPTDGQIPESATSKTPEAKPVDPATAVAEAAPAGPTADPTEIAALELVLADPSNKDIIENFGGKLEPLPTWSTVGQGIEARYGADLGGRLYQLQNAQRAVEGEYFKAKDLAKDAPPSIPAPYIRAGSKDIPVSDRPGWIYSPAGHADGDPPSWQFDEVAFARDYAAGDTPAQRGLASLHGSNPLTFVPHWGGDGTAESHWALDGLITRPDVERLDPNRITKLINNQAVWFDPVQGFSTDIENLKPNAIDRAFPYVFAAAATVITFGAAGAVGGPAAASVGAAGGSTASTGMLGGAVSGAFGGGTAGSIAVGAASGAFNSAVLQFVVNGKVDFGQVVKSAVSGGVTAGMSKLPGVGQYIDGAANTFGQRLMEYTGRATVQGALQTVLGGKFQDGFAGSLLSGLAGEVTGHIDAQIKDMKGLTGAETGTLHLLNRAVGTAMRLVGSDDPASGFASDFLGGLIQEGARSQDSADVGVDNPSKPSSGNPAHAPQQTAGNTTASDPLGDFIAANEQSWADRDDLRPDGLNSSRPRKPDGEEVEGVVINRPAHVEVSGVGWVDDVVLPDGTIVWRPNGAHENPNHRMIEGVPVGGEAPQIFGYVPIEDAVRDGVRQITYRPQSESTFTYVLNQIAERAPGAVEGALNSFAHMAESAVQQARNNALIVGDLLTLGYNHDHPVVQQAWSEQQQVGQRFVNTILRPRETTTDAIESVVTRYNAAIALPDPHAQSQALSQLFNDVGQSALGLGYSAASIVRPIAGAVTTIGENAFTGPMAGGRRAQRGGVGDLGNPPAVGQAAVDAAAQRPQNTTRFGILRTNRSDWRELISFWDDLGYGEILSSENRLAIARGKTPRVDNDWIAAFPEDAGLIGERIPMHHIGGQSVTIPLPDTRHRDAHMPGGYRYNPGGPGSAAPFYPKK